MNPHTQKRVTRAVAIVAILGLLLSIVLPLSLAMTGY